MSLVMRRWLFSAPVSLAVLAIFAAPLHAQFFDGGTSNPGDWDDPINWDGDVLPGGGSNVEVGTNGFTNATATITAPLTNPTIADLRVGAGGAGGNVGVINQSTGSLTATGWAFVGLDSPPGNPGNIGRYNLSGDASFTVDFAANGGQQEFHVGLGGGAGAANEGYVSVADQASLSFPRGYIGSNDGNYGQLDQTGGSVNVDTWMSIGRNGASTGVYNMSGGSLTVTADGLTVGENDGANGTLNISGSSVVSTPLLNVGRFGGAAQGLLTVTGSSASITASTALNVGTDSGNDTDTTGTLDFTADAGGVSPILAGDVVLNDGMTIGSSNLIVDMSLAPAGDILLVDNTGANAVSGTFAGLPEGAAVPGSGGRTISYVYGDGNNIALVAIPEPTAALLAALGLGIVGIRRQR